MDEFLSSAALNPGSIGPTLPPMQPFQFPTGPTGSTGATGATGSNGDFLYPFNSTFTWIDTPPDPIIPGDPIPYRIVANIGGFSETVTSVQVGNRGFSALKLPPDPI